MSPTSQDGEATTTGAAKFTPIVPHLNTTGITTAGKGDEMLNILVNDSFSTNKSGKRKKKGKKGKGKKDSAQEMGYSAMEILQMKETEKLENAKPQTRPVVYFKDFEKRFDDLLTKNKTPRAETISTISPRQRGGDTARTTKSQSNPEEAKNKT